MGQKEKFEREKVKKISFQKVRMRFDGTKKRGRRRVATLCIWMGPGADAFNSDDESFFGPVIKKAEERAQRKKNIQTVSIMSIVSNVMPGLWTPAGPPPAEQKKQHAEEGEMKEEENVKDQDEQPIAAGVVSELRRRFESQNKDDEQPVTIEEIDEPVSHLVTQRRKGLRPQKGVYESGFIVPTRGIAVEHNNVVQRQPLLVELNEAIQKKPERVDNESSLPTFVVDRNPLEESANNLAQRVVDKQIEVLAFGFHFLTAYICLLCDKLAVALKIDKGFDLVCGIFSFSRWCFVTVPGFGLIAVALALGWVWQMFGIILTNFWKIITFLIALSVIINLCLAIAGYRGPVQMQHHHQGRQFVYPNRDPRVAVPRDFEAERVRNEGVCVETKSRYQYPPPGPKGRTLEEERKEMETIAKKMVQEALNEAKIKADKEHAERERALFKHFANVPKNAEFVVTGDVTVTGDAKVRGTVVDKDEI